MGYRCGNSCLRKQSPPMRCQTCTDSRHANRDAGRLSTTLYVSGAAGVPKTRAAGQTGKPRLGQATIERFRLENPATQVAAANGAGGQCRHTWRRPANAAPDAIAFTCTKCGATQQV